MKVTEKDVAYVADLANLELSAEERAGMLRDLNSILDYVDRLNELDTSMSSRWRRFPIATAWTNQAGQRKIRLRDREDVVEGLRKSLPQEEALANAPDADGTFFRVPKVIEKDSAQIWLVAQFLAA